MIHTARPPIPEQTVIVRCGTCRRMVGSVSSHLLDTQLGRTVADSMRRGLVTCCECGGDLDGEALP